MPQGAGVVQSLTFICSSCRVLVSAVAQHHTRWTSLKPARARRPALGGIEEIERVDAPARTLPRPADAAIGGEPDTTCTLARTPTRGTAEVCGRTPRVAASAALTTQPVGSGRPLLACRRRDNLLDAP